MGGHVAFCEVYLRRQDYHRGQAAHEQRTGSRTHRSSPAGAVRQGRSTLHHNEVLIIDKDWTLVVGNPHIACRTCYHCYHYHCI